MKSKKSRFLIITIILLAIVGGVYIYKEYNRTNKNLTNAKADYSIKADSLIGEYLASDSLANKKYLGELLEVGGYVKEVANDENGYYSIVLGDTSSMSSVRCKLDSLENSKISDALKGKVISVKGICTGFIADEFGIGSDVILERCIVKSKNN